MADLIEKAKDYAKSIYGKVKEAGSSMVGTAEAIQKTSSLKNVRERQGPGFYQADIGEGRNRTYQGEGGDFSVTKPQPLERPRTYKGDGGDVNVNK